VVQTTTVGIPELVWGVASMFKTIVVGTDGSDTAAKAVQVAAELAGASTDGALHIVSVGKTVPHAAVAMGETATAGAGIARAQIEEDSTKDLQELLSRAAASVEGVAPTVETYPRLGNPAEVLCQLGEQIRADLIVVGNQGMQGGRRFLGSVPNSVSHHAPCSVLIVSTA